MAPEHPDLPFTRQELLTRHFYDWEMRGRGGRVWDGPVDLEPPFRPFSSHALPAYPADVLDDARRQTALSILAHRVSSYLSEKNIVSPPSPPLEEVEEPAPEPFLGDRAARGGVE